MKSKYKKLMSIALFGSIIFVGGFRSQRDKQYKTSDKTQTNSVASQISDTQNIQTNSVASEIKDIQNTQESIEYFTIEESEDTVVFKDKPLGIGFDITVLEENSEATSDNGLSLEIIKFPLLWSEPTDTKFDYGIIYDIQMRNKNEITITTNDYRGVTYEGDVIYYAPILILYSDYSYIYARLSGTSEKCKEITYNDDGTVTFTYSVPGSFDYNNFDRVEIGNFKRINLPISLFTE